MKVSDYIVEFLIEKGVTDMFGYPGGMVTHLMDSLGKKKECIRTHINYHEQASAFAACGYAQATGRTGVAFATSGPGATNLITGIGHAYFDSVPTVFITGQVNTFESKGRSGIRQKGFQETDIVSMVRSITKWATYVDSVEDIPDILLKAFEIAESGRKGPVLIDIPMDIFRSNINVDKVSISENKANPHDMKAVEEFKKTIDSLLDHSQRPCLLIGNGIKLDDQVEQIREMLRGCPIPVVSSIMAVDVIPEYEGLEGIYYGFIGAYGNRSANFTVAKCDLLICLGTRLDVRQVGARRSCFAPNATIVRVDIDEYELSNKIRDNEYQFKILLSDAIPAMGEILQKCRSYEQWINVCKEIKSKVKYIDEYEPNKYLNEISKITSDEYHITADVGQNMMWTAQSFKLKPRQRLFISGGMGSMGYSLPAAIGIHYATNRPIICINGDGGLQMNIQELMLVAREKLPIKIFVINNNSLGMIRHFQKMYFESRFYYTTETEGYNTPDFCGIAEAYGIKSHYIDCIEDIRDIEFDNGPELYNICLKGVTEVSPKLEFGKPNQDQEPLLDRELYNYLMEL